MFWCYDKWYFTISINLISVLLRSIFYIVWGNIQVLFFHGSVSGCCILFIWPMHACSTSTISLSCIGEGNGNPLQVSCLENPRDTGAWWAAVYGVTQSWTRLKQLSSSSSRKSRQRRQWNPTPVLLPGKSHGWRSLVGCSPWGRKESDMTSLSLSFKNKTCYKGR